MKVTMIVPQNNVLLMLFVAISEDQFRLKVFNFSVSPGGLKISVHWMDCFLPPAVGGLVNA